MSPLTESALLYRQRPMHFAAVVDPLATVELLDDLGGRDATVEELTARFYAGQQRALHVQVLKLAHQTEYSLIHFPKDGVQYLAGDDDRFNWQISEPILGSQGEQLLVRFINTDAANKYGAAIDLSVDFAGGALPREAVV